MLKLAVYFLIALRKLASYILVTFANQTSHNIQSLFNAMVIKTLHYIILLDTMTFNDAKINNSK